MSTRSRAENMNESTSNKQKGTPDQRQTLTTDGYLEAALSKASKRAYASDLREFVKWGGSIPSTSEQVATYLAEMATTLANATLQRRMISIHKAHTEAGYESPVRTPKVKQVLAGISRTFGTRQVRARPILKDDLLEMLVMVDQQRPVKAARDKALLLIGFAGAFRRSELVAIRCEDITEYPSGIEVLIQRSKTDQEGVGRTVFIPYANGTRCPVAALKDYKTISGIGIGFLFRAVHQEHVSESPLTPQSVALILKAAAKRVGVDPSAISGHSLRAGYCTQAAIAGRPQWEIRAQTGHKSDLVLARYIRPVLSRMTESLL
ncbi:MAG: site-specific integrase [Rhodocyclales bacterium]|nr:site-specific integrase [Rhodocyclales bacterium]